MAELSKERLKEIKKKVLREMTHVLCAELGDVSRYLISLKGKGVLDNLDCEIIRAPVTTPEKIEAMMNLLDTREGREGEAALDMLIEVLRDGMHPNLARRLQTALVRAKNTELNVYGEHVQ